VYMGAVLEYLAVELLEITGEYTKGSRTVRITPRHIVMGIRQDEELDLLMSRVTIPGGGVPPHIESVLLPKSSGSNSKKNEAGPSNAAKVLKPAVQITEKAGGGSKAAGAGSKSTAGATKANFKAPNTVGVSKAGGASKAKEPEPTRPTRANSKTRSESRAPSEDIGKKRKNTGKP
jgi:hypothetical protein